MTSWVYSVGFKRRRSGRIIWVLTTSQDVVEASRQANAFMAQRHPNEGYQEYGMVKEPVDALTGKTKPKKR